MRRDTPLWSLVALMMIFGWVILMSRCHAAEVTLAWDPAPVEQKVSEWRVYRVEGDARTPLATVDAPTVVIEASVGQTIAVTAWNGIEGKAATIVIPEVLPPPSAPTGIRVVEIQTSLNLKDWKTLAYVPLNEKDQAAKFVRTTLTTVTR